MQWKKAIRRSQPQNKAHTANNEEGSIVPAQQGEGKTVCTSHSPERNTRFQTSAPKGAMRNMETTG